MQSAFSETDLDKMLEACAWGGLAQTLIPACLRWARKHKFWKTRIVSLGAFTNALSRDDEKGLVAQFMAHVKALADRTPEGPGDSLPHCVKCGNVNREPGTLCIAHVGA